ncbi:transmembrane protein 260, partial [Argonauta hians]
MDLFSMTMTVGLLSLYLSTLYPDISGGDTGELLSAACEYGVPHPPGYPLFTLLNILAVKGSGFKNPAWRTNALNALISALAGGVLSHTVHRETRQPAAALLVVALFSTNRLTWRWSLTSEVFALNNLLIAVIIYLSFSLEKASQPSVKLRLARCGAFLSALCLCNQHTSLVYLCHLVPWVAYKLHRGGLLSFTTWLSLLVPFLLGLTPYIYLPLSAHLNIARWTWGDQRTLSGFWTHLIRSEYGTFDLGKDEVGLGFIMGLKFYMIHEWYTVTPVAIVLFGMSMWCIARRWHSGFSCPLVLLLMFGSYVTLFMWRANLNINNALFLGVVERFWMQSTMVLTVLASLTYGDVYNCIKYNFFRHMFFFFSTIILVFQVHRNYAQCNRSNSTVVRDFSMSVLDSFPPNSTILTRGDLSSTTFGYLHFCQKVRPDLKMFDQELLTYEWSLPMLKKHHGRIKFPGDFLHLKTQRHPDGRRSFSFAKFLNANYASGPIFACIGVQDYEPSWKKSYHLWPYGVCHRFVQKKDKLTLKSWLNATSEVAFNWTHAHTGFPETSWEKVATDSMWNAKISAALHVYEVADKKKKGNAYRNRLLVMSYQMYSRAISYHDNFPPFWHKNYALVCTSLLNAEHDFDKELLLRKSIYHLQFYVDSDPDDDEIQNIRDAITSLKHYGRQIRDRARTSK